MSRVPRVMSPQGLRLQVCAPHILSRLPGFLAACLASWFLDPASAGDWTQWGGRDCRNMISEEKNLPETFDPGKKKTDGSGIDMATTKNVKWAVRLGSETYGNPAVSGGRVFIGTNNGAPRNRRYQGDWGTLMCFDERTGNFLWQLVVSKLRDEGNFNGDCANLGVCSSPTVEGNRVYVVTTRCEVLCLDVEGLANGNDGPFLDEGEYVSVRLRHKPGKPPKGVKPPDKPEPPPPPPLTLDPTDADIIWRYDMMAELDIWTQDACDCSVLLRGDLLYTCTSNGVDRSHRYIPSPEAPTLIALDKRTGKLVATDEEDIGKRFFHGNWSSPSLAKVNGREELLLGAGDGFCYAFDPNPVDVPGRKAKVLKTIWKCDGNPPDYRTRDGKPLPYNQRAEGPSEMTGTPVFWRDRVYTTVGQDTRHGAGKGCLTCMDATKTGDISATGVLWRYTGINRSLATPSVTDDGLLFTADFIGTVHCLDAMTGQVYWTQETGWEGKGVGGQCMGSTFVADGKVYFGNGAGILTVLAATREKKLISQVRLGAPMHATPIAANGVLYIPFHTYLYALQAPK